MSNLKEVICTDAYNSDLNPGQQYFVVKEDPWYYYLKDQSGGYHKSRFTVIHTIDANKKCSTCEAPIPHSHNNRCDFCAVGANI